MLSIFPWLLQNHDQLNLFYVTHAKIRFLKTLDVKFQVHSVPEMWRQRLKKNFYPVERHVYSFSYLERIVMLPIECLRDGRIIFLAKEISAQYHLAPSQEFAPSLRRMMGNILLSKEMILRPQKLQVQLRWKPYFKIYVNLILWMSSYFHYIASIRCCICKFSIS